MAMDYLANGGVGLGNAYVDTAQVKSTFLDPLGNAHGSLNEAVGRLRMLADRLCGSQPEQPPGDVQNKLAAVPSGLFDEIATRGNDMNRKITTIHDLIGRIERALP